MKALTISQPFASLIANGEKWVENRRWGTSYRGPLAIHAGKGTQYLDRNELAQYPSGCIIAIARIVACVELSVVRSSTLATIGGRTLEEFLNHEHTEGPWCWVLDNVRELPDPVQCKGAQGLWDWKQVTANH
jgi:hypothetical protein